MREDLRGVLWALKGGTILNLVFLGVSFSIPSASVDSAVVIPARIFFVISAYRCFFPNRYKDNVVLHNTILSSTLVTRSISTRSEIVYIFLFAYVIGSLNVDRIFWIDALATWMVVQVTISQVCVWWAILGSAPKLYYYEELGWWIIFAINTLTSVYLLSVSEPEGGAALLLWLNVVFGVFYLPWQILHLRSLLGEAQAADSAQRPDGLSAALRETLFDRRQTTEYEAWGGGIGGIWMVSYWAVLIPGWMMVIVEVLGRSRP